MAGIRTRFVISLELMMLCAFDQSIAQAKF